LVTGIHPFQNGEADEANERFEQLQDPDQLEQFWLDRSQESPNAAAILLDP